MKIVTIDDIRAFRPKPCYDPGRYLADDWSGTALDILAVEECPAEDRLWVVLRTQCVEQSLLNAFARWCALSVAHLWQSPMPDVVRQFLETGDEMLRSAAWAAAWSAAGAAARSAAWSAASDAARAATWAAASAATSAAQVEHLRGLLAEED
jgi:hypothetical protein